MKVRELKNFLELNMDERLITQALTGYSHWINAIFQAGEFVSGNEKDIKNLKSLEELKLIDLTEKAGKMVAVLNKSGKQLYQDFFGHGYF